MIFLLANIQKRHNCFNTNKLLIVLTILISLFSICNVSFSQGRRDLDKFRTYVYNPFDTSKTKFKDSTQYSIEDSLRRLPVDSTARVKYFKYYRNYVYGTQVVEKRYPLLMENSSLIKTDNYFSVCNFVYFGN